MRIATYNLWHSEAGMPDRKWELLDVVQKTQADILCLQEVWPDMAEMLERCFPAYHMRFDADQELALLSRYPVKEIFGCSAMQGVCLQVDGAKIAVMNVHLPWDGALKREKAIVQICSEAEAANAMYTLLAGDFNCSDASSVQRFLTGDQSLLGAETCWLDLGSAWAERQANKPEDTLDFMHNTRWNRPGVQPNTIETSQRFDRILLKNCYPAPFPALEGYALFGKEKSRNTELMPSDHYGICATLKIE